MYTDTYTHTPHTHTVVATEIHNLYYKYLCSQHLQAIEFLSRIEVFQSHAVHFAIALRDMDLLTLTDSIQSKLSKNYM